MTGRIIRIISNLYTVDVNGVLHECRARGKFKNDGLTPLVGDIVDITCEDYIINIHNRKNELTRPNVANIDKCIIVSSLTRPSFSAFLLDKMLINVILNNIKPIIVLTKEDLLTEEEKLQFKSIIDYYNSIGIPTILNTEVDVLDELIASSTVVLTGQTGVGKSSLLNRLNPDLNLATNDISEALGRGKHTTRHTELFKYKTSYIVDTPGFSALDIKRELIDNVRFAFPEFKNEECKFNDCKHLNEKDCQVLKDLENGLILKSRYESYKKVVINEK